MDGLKTLSISSPISMSQTSKSTDFISSRFPHKDRYIEEKIIHPDYQCKTMENDITLLKVEPIIKTGENFPKHIKPISLPCIRNQRKKWKGKGKKVSERRSRSHQKLKSRSSSQRNKRNKRGRNQKSKFAKLR